MYSLDDDWAYQYLKYQVKRWLRRRKKHTEGERMYIALMIYRCQLENRIDKYDRDGLLYKLYGGPPPWTREWAIPRKE